MEVEAMERPGLQHKMKNKPETIKESYKGSEKLKGKVALITGGDSGIGRAVAVHFAREGADVIFGYLSEHEDAEKTKKLVEQEGQKCEFLAGNLINKEACNELVDFAFSKFGKVDILVNNAATQYVHEEIKDMKFEQIKETFDLNIVSMIYLTKLVVPKMEKGSRIINTSSITGYKGHEVLLDYSATKGAIASFTRALSTQIVDKEILVNGVAPGPILTPYIPATMGNVEDFGSTTPMKRCGQPSEVAPAYVFLASEDSSYITGQMIHVNGGVVIGG